MATQKLLASARDRYRTSCRKDKSRILDEFIATIDSDRAVFGNCADSLAIPRIATPADGHRDSMRRL